MVIKNLVEGKVKRQFEMPILCIKKPNGPWGIDLQKSDLLTVGQARRSYFDLPLIFAVLKKIKEKQITITLKHQYKTWSHGILASFVTIYNQDKFNYLKLAIL